MKQQTKLQIEDSKIDINISDIVDGATIDQVINQINLLRKHIKSHHTHHRFEIERYGYDGGFDIELVLFREETDEEYNQRLLKMQQRIEKAELKRLKELEQKFNSTSRSQEEQEYQQLRKKYSKGDIDG